MGFLERLQSDLKQAVLEHQRALVVQLLQRRFAELTLDDLRTLLASPLGRGLGAVRIADLAPAQPVPGAKGHSPAPKSGSTVTKKSSSKKASSKKASSKKKVKSKPRRKKIAGTAIVASVLKTLQAEGAPISGPDLAKKIMGHRSSVGRALRELIAAGKVVTSGRTRRLRYAAASTQEVAADAGQETKPRRAASTKATKATGVARPRAAASTPPSPAAFDAAVLSTVSGAGDRISSTAILAKIGGSIDQVRAALRRLVAANQVVRVGEGKLTRYVSPGHS